MGAPTERRIELLGAAFTVRADESPEAFERAYRLLESRVKAAQKISPKSSPLVQALLAGLQLAEDAMLGANGSGPRLDDEEAERLLARLSSRLDEALGESS
jgi:hypothetical protein